eukprot:3515669-Rhodomonas_salina.1
MERKKGAGEGRGRREWDQKGREGSFRRGACGRAEGADSRRSDVSSGQSEANAQDDRSERPRQETDLAAPK